MKTLKTLNIKKLCQLSPQLKTKYDPIWHQYKLFGTFLGIIRDFPLRALILSNWKIKSPKYRGHSSLVSYLIQKSKLTACPRWSMLLFHKAEFSGLWTFGISPEWEQLAQIIVKYIGSLKYIPFFIY